MNWLHFGLWVTGIYILYYLVNILIDNAIASRSPDGKEITKELTFMVDEKPQVMEYKPETIPIVTKSSTSSPVAATVYANPVQKAEPAIIGSGGVILKDLFNLARQDALIYIRSVSY
ncbi:hypothetical protein [Mucilaginibacter sp. FT3.2]|uniref:hypothetical protein n=1 Tax=Mucilaginibacter sp. FT3.2 TaxID=2723090 RepID=UPI00161B92F0|nr:hypothetical protein [Mucilaginibacter sp. FT3.2]MBB6234269.1 hypothetical protein [Mucilaginibacter sp. FT3.2]